MMRCHRLRTAIATARPLVRGTLLSIDSRRDGSTHAISLRGELDVASVDDVQRELLRVERSDARRVVLDLSGLSFMDSSGVHLVVDAHARCRADANRLRIVRGAPNVQRVFVRTDLHAHLPFVG